jgi:hypothetical protein
MNFVSNLDHIVFRSSSVWIEKSKALLNPEIGKTDRK